MKRHIISFKYLTSKLFLLVILLMGMTGGNARAQQWSVNPSDYHYDMRLYLDCVVGSGITDYSGYSFAAFVGDECRGMGKILTELPVTVFYMTVYSNIVEGEKVSFKAYDSSTNSTYLSENSIEFKSESSLGVPSDPFVVKFIVDPTSVTISDTGLTLIIGETHMLTATVAPDLASNTKLTWSSSDSKVATVSDNGLVTAIAKGEATITVTTANGLSDSCDIIVEKEDEPEPIVPVSIILSETSVTLNEGESLKLIATVIPADAEYTLTWSTTNSEIAIVDEKGIVTGVSEGSTMITVTTDNDLSASCEVTVLTEAGVEYLIDDSKTLDIYTINGIMLKDNVDKDYIKSLDKGIYIIRYSFGSIVIRK